MFGVGCFPPLEDVVEDGRDKIGNFEGRIEKDFHKLGENLSEVRRRDFGRRRRRRREDGFFEELNKSPN